MGHLRVDDPYLSPYQTRAILPWLLNQKKQALYIFVIGPWGPHIPLMHYASLFTIVGVWMITTYHHTKPEPRGCLGC